MIRIPSRDQETKDKYMWQLEHQKFDICFPHEDRAKLTIFSTQHQRRAAECGPFPGP